MLTSSEERLSFVEFVRFDVLRTQDYLARRVLCSRSGHGSERVLGQRHGRLSPQGGTYTSDNWREMDRAFLSIVLLVK